jgi:hypothetical protein
MPKEYSKEKFWKLYETLPQELKDALFSEETGNNIEDICKKNTAEENMGKIVDYVGKVLLGVLSPADFKEALEKDLGIDSEKARKIDQEIFRTIFYPVKSALEQISKAESSPSDNLTEKTPAPLKEENIPSPPKKDDSYRESIE